MSTTTTARRQSRGELRGLLSRTEWIASLALFALILLALMLAALLADPLSVLSS